MTDGHVKTLGEHVVDIEVVGRSFQLRFAIGVLLGDPSSSALFSRRSSITFPLSLGKAI